MDNKKIILLSAEEKKEMAKKMKEALKIYLQTRKHQEEKEFEPDIK